MTLSSDGNKEEVQRFAGWEGGLAPALLADVFRVRGNFDIRIERKSGDKPAFLTCECYLQFYSLLHLLIAAVALSFFNFRLRVLLHVLSERTSDIIAFLELSLIITTHVTFVVSRIYKFSFAVCFFVCHMHLHL